MKSILLFCGLLLGGLLLMAAINMKIVADPKSSYNAPLSIYEDSGIMRKPYSVLLQYVAPQRELSYFAGWLAQSQIPWLKNYLIRYFLHRNQVNMGAAIIENPYDYPSFNSFFTRKLKPEARPIVQDPKHIASPADGFVSQIGKIDKDKIFQAKGFDFTLKNLLGGSEKRAKLFENGSFATFYLSPTDYHRVHMPLTGRLRETVFIPGRLFSVNQKTTTNVPNLFARNERLVCIYDTDIGPMAVILVGAMLVGSIETVWHAKTDSSKILVESYGGSLELSRGAELGLFKMGSTVIVLFGKDKMHWDSNLIPDAAVKMGQSVGVIEQE